MPISNGVINVLHENFIIQGNGRFNTKSQPLQQFSNLTKTTTLRNNLITANDDYGVWLPISFKVGKRINYLGGSRSTSECRHQIVDFGVEEPKKTCKSDEEVKGVFEGIE